MRVLLVTSYFSPHVGGVERFVEVLAGGLAERGHEVTVLCCRTDRSSPLEDLTGAFRIVRVPAINAAERLLGTPLPVPSPLRLRHALEALVAEADVVHANDALYPTTWAAIAAALRRGVPALLTQHVGRVRQRYAALDLVQSVAIRAVGRVARRADRVVSYNPAVAAWARSIWRLPDVAVLPSGVVSASGPPDRAACGLPGDRFVALFVGRDVPKKGLRHVIAAADPDYELIAVTDAKPAPRDGVQIRPFMSPPELANLLRSVDALVLPSVDEGIPLIIQEAATAGIPIVTTDQPGLSSYFEPGDLVLVDANGESIRKALLALRADPARRAALARRVENVGRIHFDAGAFVTAYEQTYAEIAGYDAPVASRD